MTKSLRDARITDGLPRILAKQPWIQALSEAMGIVHEMTMTFADRSQIYTGVDYAAEDILDALAVSWKIDWYDTGYSIEQKRRIVKTALTVRRTMGTAAAVKAQAEAIYPGTTVQEWFQYGGEPGTFRLYVDVTTTNAEYPLVLASNEEIERRIVTAKRFSATMESMSYQLAHGIELAVSITAWRASPPVCGMIACGIYPKIKTLGWSEKNTVSAASVAEAFAVALGLCGTLPEVSTIGRSMLETVINANDVSVYQNSPPVSGGSDTNNDANTPPTSGTIPEIATHGLSIEESTCSGENIVVSYSGTPPVSGLIRCGVKLQTASEERR